MSWLIPRKREEKKSADNVICGVSIIFKSEGEDVVAVSYTHLTLPTKRIV